MATKSDNVTATFVLSDVLVREGEQLLIPYNQCELSRGPGSTVCLANAKLLGLNPLWLQTPPRRKEIPEKKTDSTTTKRPTAPIKQPELNFPYWGHLIQNSIDAFNRNSQRRHDGHCRKLVYLLRHGEADHNRWKKLRESQWGLQSGVDGAKPKELRKYPSFVEDNNEYCLIDPPLTGKGETQADRAHETFKTLQKHEFPMPASVYCSPLRRAIQTCKKAIMPLGLLPRSAYHILNDLREQLTGNSADILWDEYFSEDPKKHKEPPKAASGERTEWMETGNMVSERAKSVVEQIFAMDNSPCIALVYHSLLIQKTLALFERTNHMQTFMLDEGGLFALVIEGKCATKEGIEKRKTLRQVAPRRSAMAKLKRKSTAFPNVEI